MAGAGLHSSNALHGALPFTISASGKERDAMSMLLRQRGFVDPPDGQHSLDDRDQKTSPVREALVVGHQWLKRYLNSFEGLEPAERKAQIREDRAAEKFIAWTEAHGVRSMTQHNHPDAGYV